MNANDNAIVQTMKSLKFGIEIETVGRSPEALSRIVQSIVGGTSKLGRDDWGRTAYHVVDPRGREWKAVIDGSLSGGSYGSGEVVSPVLAYEDIEELQRIVRALREAGARSDSSCGIHVHVDGSSLDAKSIVNIVKYVHKQERLLLAEYCRPISTEFIERIEKRRPETRAQLSEAWYGRSNEVPCRYDTTRYHGLNLNSLFYRGTIEFRYFQSSSSFLHAGEIKSYVQLALALVAKGLTTKKTPSLKRRPFDLGTTRFDARVLSIRLGLIGPEFETVRYHLTKSMSGRNDRNGRGGPRRARGHVAPVQPDACVA